MDVQGVSNNQTTGGSTTTSITSKDAFLQILIAQLKFQDPLEPMKPDQMLTQLSQLTQVEQLTNLATSMEGLKKTGEMSTWVSAIGKKVDAPSTVLAKGDEIAIVPRGDYDTVVIKLQDASNGSTSEVTLRKGQPLTYVHDGDESVAVVSVTASLNGNAVSSQSVVYKLVKGIKQGSGGPLLVFANDETYDASQVSMIKN
jgi:flagellar basal-body rod modification protein FlgD